MLKKISGRGLTAARVFRAESMSLNLGEKDSTASLTVDESAGSISTGDWVQDLEEPGKGIVWRVKKIDDQKDKKTRTISLEHIINTLKDQIIPTAISTSDISGSSSNPSARQAINKILSYQNDWQLGNFDYDGVTNPYHFDGDTLMKALETVTSSLEDPVWSYDFSSYPFTLNIKQLSADADSEMRAGRNLTSIRVTEDRSQMYTRFYPRGKNNIKLSGSGYIEKNVDAYGLVEKTETDSSKESESELTTWANERLDRHARPGHTVSISGIELSESTGETLDKLIIGHKCRVPLPDDGETVIEKITKLSWRDKIKDPKSMTVTLADALDDVASIIKEETEKSGGGRRAAAKADEENELLIGSVEEKMYSVIAQTSTNIYMNVTNLLEGYATVEITASMISAAVSTARSDLYSTIQQTATNVLITVANTLEGYSTIEATASAITLAVASGKSDLYSSVIRQTSTSIFISVRNAKSDLYSAIDVQADRISLVVQGTGANASIKPASIVASINNGASTIKLSANHIDIDGIITSLEAKDVMVNNFNAYNGEFTGDLSVLGDVTMAGDLTVAGNEAEWKSFSYDTFTYGTKSYILYASSQTSQTPSGSVYAYPVTAHTSHTIYYLGHD